MTETTQEKIISIDSHEAAEYKSVEGWASANSQYFGEDEYSARYDGCTHVRCGCCGELRRKNALNCEGCEQLQIKQRWDEAEKTDWADGGTVYSAKVKKFYSDKEIYKKVCLEIKCSTEDMLLFACNPIYSSNVSKSTILGQELREAILPSSIIEKLNDLNTAIDACEPLAFSVNEELGVVPSQIEVI